MKNQSATRCGYVALVGRPNVGKSTLLNALVGEKLAIVTPKPQTTRSVVSAIVTDHEAQMVLLDTPGLLVPRYKLQEAMVEGVKRSLRDADVMLLLLDAALGDKAFGHQERKVLSAARVPVVVVLNKADIAAEGVTRALSDALAGQVPAERLMAVSALTGDHVGELRALLRSLLPAGPFLYPEEQIAEQSERFFVAEIIREKILSMLRQEVPYATAVVVEEFKEREPKTLVRATIYVERASQRNILVGADGEMLKKVGQAARADIERFIEHPVYLELWVKVRENWRRNERDLREFGYLK